MSKIFFAMKFTQTNNTTISLITNGTAIISASCYNCYSTKRLIKEEHQAEGLLSSLRWKTTSIEVPIFGDCFDCFKFNYG